MTGQEKLTLWNMLQTVEKSLPGFNSLLTLQNQPFFQDDVQIESQKTQNENPVNKEDFTSSGNSQNISASDENFSNKDKVLLQIKQRIASCKNCILCKTRSNTVPGTGVTNPLVLVIGEGPGFEEDMSGQPFVGNAGKLLDKMLASIQLSRTKNCFITNVVKCRPPQNRNPYPEEMDACNAYLLAQISVLKPKLILCVGSVASQKLLSSSYGVTKLRGSFYETLNIPVAVTYHPSALLRDNSLKAYAWQDLKMVREKLLELEPNYQTQNQ